MKSRFSAAANNKGFVVTTKKLKLSCKPFKATIAVAMGNLAGASARYKSKLGKIFTWASLLRHRQY